MTDELEQMSPNQRRALDKALSALETFAAIWAAEIRLGAMSARIAAVPNEAERAKRIAAMIEQGFIEGAYRHYLDHKDKCDELEAACAIAEPTCEACAIMMPHKHCVDTTSVTAKQSRNSVIEECCVAIKAEDDRMADEDYMLDSNDCIKVCRALKSQQDAAIESKPAEQKDSAEIEALRLLYREAVYWRSMQSWNGKVALKKAIAAVDAAIESQRSEGKSS